MIGESPELDAALDPAQARMQRLLKLVVISLGMLIVAILGVIVVTVLGRVGDMSDDVSSPAGVTENLESPSWNSAAAALSAGTEVEHMAIGNGVLALHVRTADGAQKVLLVDLASGAITGQLNLTAP